MGLRLLGGEMSGVPRGNEETTERGWRGLWAWWARAVGRSCGRPGEVLCVRQAAEGQGGGRGNQAGILSSWAWTALVAEWGAEAGSWTAWSRVEFGFSACVTQMELLYEGFGCWLRALSVENYILGEKCLAIFSICQPLM